MKFHKLHSLLLVPAMTGFLLTACGASTSHVSDQRGRGVSVTASDSDTYTFKLPAVSTKKPKEVEVEVIEEVFPEEPVVQEEAVVIPEDKPKEELPAVGPKTGEFWD